MVPALRTQTRISHGTEHNGMNIRRSGDWVWLQKPIDASGLSVT